MSTISPSTHFTSDSISARPLNETDLPEMEALSKRHPMRFLTPLLNIAKYGLQSETLRTWGAFDSKSQHLQGLLLRLNNTIITADADGACAPPFAAIIDAEPAIAGVRGSVEIVAAIQSLLQRYTPTHWEDSYYLRLLKPPQCPPEILGLARLARPDDLNGLTALYAEAGNMYRSRANVATKLAETKLYVVEEAPLGRRAGRIASCALLSPEGPQAAIIGGVFTLPSARGKGYASACVSALARDLQKDKKLPCLFYENPAAGRVYRQLGFEECGRWAVLYLVRQVGFR